MAASHNPVVAASQNLTDCQAATEATPRHLTRESLNSGLRSRFKNYKVIFLPQYTICIYSVSIELTSMSLSNCGGLLSSGARAWNGDGPGGTSGSSSSIGGGSSNSGGLFIITGARSENGDEPIKPGWSKSGFLSNISRSFIYGGAPINDGLSIIAS